MNERAVSEIVGYIFVFAIVLSAISYVYINVSNIVKDTSEKYRVEGLRESFQRIMNIFFLSTYGGAPAQSIQMELQGGTLSIRDEPHIELKVNSTTILDTNTKSLVYEFKDYSISIENGAIYENYYGYNRTILDPRIFIQKVEVRGVSGIEQNVTMVVIYMLNGNLSISGMGAIDLIFQSRVKDSRFVETPGVLTMNITSPFAENWHEYFANTLGVPSKINNNKVSVSINFDKAIITIYEVNVTYRMI